MKKFFKGLLGVIAVIILILCALIVYNLATGKEVDLPFIEPYNSQEQTTVTTSEIPEETAGGNAGDGEVQYSYYEVTVSEDRYITENGELTLDEVISEVGVLGEDYIVRIIDNNASLKAYNELTDRLADISVPYMEDDGEIHT